MSTYVGKSNRTLHIYLIFILIVPIKKIKAQSNYFWSTGFNISNTEQVKTNVNLIFAKQYNLHTPYIGFGYSYELSGKVNLVGESQLSIKGYRRKGTYFQPVMMNYNIRELYAYLDLMPKIKYEIRNNLFLGFGINCGLKFFEGEYQNYSIEKEKIKSLIDFGYLYSLSLKRKRIEYRIQYNHGIVSRARFSGLVIDPILEFSEFKEYNRNIQLGVVVLINKND